jgi:hypothetical protein
LQDKANRHEQEDLQWPDGRRPVSLHDWLGTHIADTKDSHWEGGHFVSACTICGKAMEKLPGLAWKLRKRGSA